MPGYDLPSQILLHEQPFSFELGGEIPELRIAYESWGDLSPARDNVTVVIHALSGSSHCFATPANPDPGWWRGLIENDAPICPSRDFILCSNLIGGCYGTTGPSSIDPRTGKEYRLSFPQICIKDTIEAQRILLRSLGIDQPVTLIGGSMGGMIALEWAIRYPDEVGTILLIASPARSYPQSIALRSVQREAIIKDPNWNGGNYDEANFPHAGVALARKIGMITYRCDEEFTQRFSREERDSRPHFLDGMFEIQSYLDHQGRKFADRFDPNSYLYFSRAMDLFDASNGFESLEEAVDRIRARCLLMGIDSDWLCPSYQVEETFDALHRQGKNAVFQPVHSTHGHDAFLIEMDQIRGHIRKFLDGS